MIIPLIIFIPIIIGWWCGLLTSEVLKFYEMKRRNIMVHISNIIKTTKPGIYCFKIESHDIEMLERMREEISITSRYKHNL